MTMAPPARRTSFPSEILAQLEAFCAEQRTGKIELDILQGQVMVVKGTETFFDAKRNVDRPKKDV
jgi:hypothetical protein